MIKAIRPGHAFAGRAGPVDVLSAGNSTGSTLYPLALQQRFALEADAIRERQALALATRHGLTIEAARQIAELAFAGPGRRA